MKYTTSSNHDIYVYLRNKLQVSCCDGELEGIDCRMARFEIYIFYRFNFNIFDGEFISKLYSTKMNIFLLFLRLGL